MPLLSKGIVKRFLILCPASLVEQWQERLRTMFDIRCAQYVTQADTERADFWGTHNQVVASVQTIRLDRRGRHDRLLESQPWDLVMVDEAHHLNANEDSGFTLGYRVVNQLEQSNLIQSMIFFTGTPHRGKNYNFLQLLRLLAARIMLSNEFNYFFDFCFLLNFISTRDEFPDPWFLIFHQPEFTGKLDDGFLKTC